LRVSSLLQIDDREQANRVRSTAAMRPRWPQAAMLIQNNTLKKNFAAGSKYDPRRPIPPQNAKFATR
jgi:hypothetical protein